MTGAEQGKPLVSVVMPAYNEECIIDFAIKSVLAQTYKNWELIIVDDGSSDNTYEVASQFLDERIRIFRLPINRGRPYARQYALCKAKGEFLAMLDADDWMYPEKIYKQVSIFNRHPELTAVSCGMIILNHKGAPVSRRSFGDGQVQELADPLRLSIAHAPTMIRMIEAKKNNYNLFLRNAQDIDFLRKVLKGKKFLIMEESLYCYTEHFSVNYRKVVKTYFYDAVSCFYWISRNPLSVFKRVVLIMIKAMVLSVLKMAGLFSKVIERRSISIKNELVEFHFSEKEKIEAVLAEKK